MNQVPTGLLESGSVWRVIITLFSDARRMTDQTAERPRIEPENNPWYRLATLYGQRTLSDGVLRIRNKKAWNRYMASKVGEKLRTHLINEGRYVADELKPLSPEEQLAVEKAFDERGCSVAGTGIPDLALNIIDFSNVNFASLFEAEGLIFPDVYTFSDATFSDGADFTGVTFSDGADFRGATFSGRADFTGATFSGRTDFKGATFSGRTDFKGATFSDGADFTGVTFSGGADFTGTTFSGRADFTGAILFFGRADFTDAIFSGRADFTGTTFPYLPTFRGATFSDLADFTDATFADGGIFTDVTFSFGRADFTGVTFSGRADFKGVTFSGRPIFRGATFSDLVDFMDATFFGITDFTGATFSDQANFKNAKFTSGTATDGADFKGVTFGVWADFTHTTFSGAATFRDATFSGVADFTGTTFFNEAIFTRATFFGLAFFTRETFSGVSVFTGATFFGPALFTGGTFSGSANFTDATFAGAADFTGGTFFQTAHFRRVTFQSLILFVNAEMKNQTSFEAATFISKPPLFFGAKLHEGTAWHDVNWPAPPKDGSEARKFVEAYERLKLEMDRLKKHEDELDFFAQELQSRCVQYGNWKPVTKLKIFPEIRIRPKNRKLFGWPVTSPPFTIRARTIPLYRPAQGLPIALYGTLCDYGRSYVRPLWGLLVTIATGIPLFWPHFGLAHVGQAVSISLANTFGAFGFRKDFIDPKLIECLPGMLKVVAGLQTIFGTALLFLLGLAIRNRFRMK
jgi:uncharacterized protein YjbI with pentapeptide repeats